MIELKNRRIIIRGLPEEIEILHRLYEVILNKSFEHGTAGRKDYPETFQISTRLSLCNIAGDNIYVYRATSS